MMERNREEKDKKLICNFLDGNEKAFNEIVKMYQKCIYWHARRMVGNHLDADEITQQVIILLYNKLSGFKFKSSLKTWIYRITANRCINFLRYRKLKSFLTYYDDDSLKIRASEDIILKYEQKEILDNLSKILDKLPLKQKQIFVLRHFEGMSYSEISEITGKSIGGLKANYFHAAKKVFEMVKNEK